MRSRALLAVIASVAIVAAVVYSFRPRPANTTLRASGTIEATDVDVAFQIGGRAEQVAVAEGQQVKWGEVVARLSAEELNARVRQIQASLEAAHSQAAQQDALLAMKRSMNENQIRQAQGSADASRMAADRLREGSRPEEVRVAEASLAQAESDLERRRNDFQRLSTLLGQGAISRQEYDAAQAAFRSAESSVNASRERLTLARQGPRRVEVAEAEARQQSAEAGVGIAEAGQKEIDSQRQALEAARARERELKAQLDVAQTQLGYTELRSPISGIVLTRNVESGEVVNPGTPVVTIADVDALWMNIYIPETQTGLLKLGQTVRIKVDSFPNEVFEGKVSFISSESEFTPKTIQTEEERIKLVYRVKVALENTQHRLKPGMPADAEILLN